MRWCAPHFWYEPLQGYGKALIPFAHLYTAIQAHITKRVLRHPASLGIPVISVGNLVAGGAGKTPVCLFLAQWLQEQGWCPHIIMRGYGRMHSASCLRVQPAHTVRDVGDEAWIVAQSVPTWVCARRVTAGRRAEQEGATIVILDDAHQHHGLYKDLSLVVVNEAQGFGNGWVMPAGPLREPLMRGLQRAQMIWAIGDCSTHIPPELTIPVIQSSYALSSADQAEIRHKRWVAFAGLGFPQKFFMFLRDQGADVVHTIPFPDHYRYTEQDMMDLIQHAQTRHASLITTEKDAVKWPRHLLASVKVLKPIMYVEDIRPFQGLLTTVQKNFLL